VGVLLAVRCAFPAVLWVRGEIHELKRPPSGHVYFDLCDPGELGRAPSARVAVALFAKQREVVNRILRRAGGAVRMTDGVEVRLRGAVELHAPTGQLEVVMSLIDPAYTLGRLAADRDQLLRRLAAEGLLERNHARPLSAAPLRVALVTSAGSAAAHDFLAELERSALAFRVTLVDTRVQGPGSAASVALAVARAARDDVDVVALVRGGGARTDLATFDGELVVRAIAAARVPVWTGIGHETDNSLADQVAHRSFKTPTAVAAALVERVAGHVAAVEQRWAQVRQRAADLLSGADEQLTARARRLRRDTEGALRLGEAALSVGTARAARGAHSALRQAGQLLDARAAVVAALDPARALARGWSITRDGSGRLVRDPAQLRNGDRLVTTVARGVITSTVADRG
jgi:exodeoxyribonuclease VII large subunit